MAGALALYVVEGPDEGQVFDLTDLPITLGRHPLNSLPLSDASISRYQFRILLRNDGIVIEDAGSLNGTWVNGEKITSVRIQEGDRIEFGKTTLEIRAVPGGGDILDQTDKFRIPQEEAPGAVEAMPRFQDEAYLNISAKKEDFEKIYRSYVAFSALYQIDKISHHGADLEEALAPILDFILKFTRADRACLLVKHKKGARLSPRLIRYRSETETPPGPFPISRAIVNKVIAKGEAVRAVKRDADGGTSRFILCSPLKHRRGLSGVLYLEAASREEPHSKADLELFSALAFKASSVLENALLYRDLRDLFYGTVETLVDTIQEKDRYTSGHSRRVALYCGALSEELELSRVDRRNLRLAA
ncbi:MAG: FHA domain-containing protein, partial [Planctomycetota bacterium]|nr:FHA domain-containing protein [Planctomycetota bacterium]